MREIILQTYIISLPVILGYIASYAYQTFCEIYEAYHALGGNGMGTKMKEEIDELHIRKKSSGGEN